MKKFFLLFSIFFIFFILLTCNIATAQINLVPNPSFEDTLRCPIGVPDLDGVCKDWISFKGTPDYFNNCSSNVGFNNPWGYQSAHTGQAFASLLGYSCGTPNWKEHLGVPLITQLTTGVKYYISFFVSLAYTYLYANVACNKIGATVTTYQYYDPSCLHLLPNSSIIYSNTIITDTISWIKISGSLIADSNYKYIIIGNFFDNNNTDTILLPYEVIPQDCIYYIDDVCVTTDSIYNETWTGLQNLNYEGINLIVYPNPVTNTLYIDGLTIIDKAEVYDLNGKLLLPKQLNTKQIDISPLAKGIYFIKLTTEEGSVVRKFVKE
jgi:hypothetical protein